MTSVYEDHLCTWLQKFLQANPTHPRLVEYFIHNIMNKFLFIPNEDNIKIWKAYKKF